MISAREKVAYRHDSWIPALDQPLATAVVPVSSLVFQLCYRGTADAANVESFGNDRLAHRPL
jgi:hypothetical protein